MFYDFFDVMRSAVSITLSEVLQNLSPQTYLANLSCLGCWFEQLSIISLLCATLLLLRGFLSQLYIFKKRRRKNSRRLRGYRPSVSSLRIIAIQHNG